MGGTSSYTKTFWIENQRFDCVVRQLGLRVKITAPDGTAFEGLRDEYNAIKQQMVSYLTDAPVLPQADPEQPESLPTLPEVPPVVPPVEETPPVETVAETTTVKVSK